MQQQTSLEAYFQLQEHLKTAIYGAILNALVIASLTDRELTLRLGYADPNKIRPRRNELAKGGFIYSTGKRTCLVSGKMAMEWRVR